MQELNNDLWRGGDWERPGRPLPRLPGSSLQRLEESVRQDKRRALRRLRRHRWRGVFTLLLLVSLLTAGTLVLQGLIPQLHIPQAILPSDGLDPYGEDYYSYEQQDSMDVPPSIPAAPTGSGVTVTLQPPEGETLSYAQIYEKNAPSIVSIEAQTPWSYNTGTGIVLTSDGYIITNAHVVSEAETVYVVPQSNDYLEAKLVGFAADEDLAVLKVEAQGLTPAEFGDSEALQAGESVAAIGDPLGYRSTITDGIISSLHREVDVDGIPMILIQTSAAINFGNSGGALINQYGQVVGITTIKIVSDDGSAEGLGFAIPSSRVKFVADRLIAGEDIPQTMFGITVLARNGVVTIQSTNPNSDAQRQGLRQGDIILSAGGLSVHSLQDLSLAKFNLCPGDLVPITIQRGDEILELTIALTDNSGS